MNNKNKELIKNLNEIRKYIIEKYYEVEDFVDCILLSLVSRTNMIALGEPGVAKSAIIREFVDSIDFSNSLGTPYFHIQMGSDISPNNVFGAPDISYFKENGIIKRQYKGFLPDAIIAFCSEFYRISDQVANSGIITILNEGEFKNGTDTIKTKLRFFMADTNFFPKSEDDLDFDEEDKRIMALHDRFISRVYVEALKDKENKIQMLLMDDSKANEIKIQLNDLIDIQDMIDNVELPYSVAKSIVNISEKLSNENNISLSPRRIKLSRNLVKASAILNYRDKCTKEDLIALKYSFWQNKEDILYLNEAIIKEIEKDSEDFKKYNSLFISILEEYKRNLNIAKKTQNIDIDNIKIQFKSDVNKLIDLIKDDYNNDIAKDLLNLIKKMEGKIYEI